MVNADFSTDEVLPAFATAANNLDSEQFSYTLDLARRMAERGLGPVDVFETGIPVIAKEVPPQLFADGLAFLYEFETTLHGFKLDRHKDVWEAWQRDNLGQLSSTAVDLRRKNLGYSIEIFLERGHYKEEGNGAYTSTVYVVDSPHSVKLFIPSEFPWFLTPRLSDRTCEIAPTEESLKYLGSRNWPWQKLKNRGLAERFNPTCPRPEVSEKKVLERLCNMRSALGPLLERLKQHLQERVIAVYVLGGYLWARKPNDVDLGIIVDGNRPLERLSLDGVEGIHHQLDVRVVGSDTLRLGATGVPVLNAKGVWLEAMILWGIGVLVAGEDYFADTLPPPQENLKQLARHFGNARMRLPVNDPKATRWSFEEAAIDFAATRRTRS